MLIICCLCKLAYAGAITIRKQAAGNLAPKHRVDGMTLNEMLELVEKYGENSTNKKLKENIWSTLNRLDDC